MQLGQIPSQTPETKLLKHAIHFHLDPPLTWSSPQANICQCKSALAHASQDVEF